VAYRRNWGKSLVTIRIYVEGGFEGSTKTNCRKAFSTFLAKLIRPESFKVIASGSRTQAFHDFCSALRQHSEDYIVLLVDSETTVTGTSWQHLRQREGDNWPRPSGASDDQAHLMVQVMEAWFLADQDSLSSYYKQGFLRNSLPRQKNVERLDKKVVFKHLSHASKNTQKGPYHKTKHGFDLLELIDPALVREASSHAEHLFAVLERKTAS
jgi:hypothetical protein